uniref:Adhesion G protein-coupled receptor F7 n=1 Tax=Mastacembelus armatus TaxID=205130 RepID=A0A3Q3LGD3_9TELE
MFTDPTNGTENYCIKYNYRIESCSTSQDKTSFICRVIQPQGYEMTMTLTIFNSGKSHAIQCNDTQYGVGRADDMSVIGCDKGQEGNKTAICQETGEWRLVRDTCIITTIKELLTESQVEKVPEFVVNLTQTVQQDETKVINSSTTISAIVGILNNIANVSTEVNATVINLNFSELLGSMATLSDRLVGEFANSTQRILLNRTMFNNSFHADLNSSIIIDIPNTGITNTFITTITFSTLNNVMPVRNSTFNATNNGTAINAAVVLVKINATIQNVTFSYNKVNKSLTLNPQCVFWNFTLLQNLGAWDDTGCEFVSDINNTVTCRCNHLTSFSLLMATDIPPSLREALDIITYVGVGISLASLVICLIIEGYVWKAVARNSTAFMRHVSIVNTALSLLIADICFIIAAAIANNPLENQGKDLTLPVGPCSTATFFMHFFYLALFFWMLVSGLLLFYRTVMVFSHMSKSTMLAIGFSLGYGCPLIIAAITVAVTAPGHGYVRKTDGCWLNWSETKALLALVIPALTIVLINMLIVIVVLFKMLRRGVGDITQRDERHTLVVVARCVIILTPLFGLTWSLGVGTMVSSTDKGIHIAFAFFNSLQGFSILVFGTLFDSKVLGRWEKVPQSQLSLQPSTSWGFMAEWPDRSLSSVQDT